MGYSIFFMVYFVVCAVAIGWIFYQGFSPNSKMNQPEPEDEQDN